MLLALSVRAGRFSTSSKTYEAVASAVTVLPSLVDPRMVMFVRLNTDLGTISLLRMSVTAKRNEVLSVALEKEIEFWAVKPVSKNDSTLLFTLP